MAILQRVEPSLIQDLVIAELSKLSEPPRSKTPQELRRSTWHLGFTDDVCVNSNQCAISQFLHVDRPLRRKSSVLRLGQVSYQPGRIALPYDVSARNHNRVI